MGNGGLTDQRHAIGGQSDAGTHVQFLSNFGLCTSLLGEYVRERKLLSLEEAVRQPTSLPLTGGRLWNFAL